jgi:hypothetical protein
MHFKYEQHAGVVGDCQAALPAHEHQQRREVDKAVFVKNAAFLCLNFLLLPLLCVVRR